jgi:hypothetical protein
MDDERLERRLRTDPSGDTYEPGAFLDRLASGQAARAVAGRTRPGPPLGLVVTVVAVVAAIAVVRPAIVGPGGTPTTPPSPSVATQIGLHTGDLQRIVDAWADAHERPSGSISFIGPIGEQVSLVVGAGSSRVGPPVVRLGDGSRTFVYMASVLVTTCSAPLQWDCAFPVEAGAFRLDDTVGRWYPDATIADRTIRQLLEGTSGMAPIGPSLVELAGRIAAEPAADWSRAALLRAALHAPPRFAAGERREPVDAESALLEDLIGRATGRDAATWVDSGIISHVGLAATTVEGGTPPSLVAGHSDADVLADLEPLLLQALGVSGSAASTSGDLAHLATIAWGAATVIPVDGLRALTNADGGHRAPWGAIGYCPCDVSGDAVIGRPGHAIGWSSLTAYDLGTKVSVGLVLDRDLDDQALESLLAELTSAFRR